MKSVRQNYYRPQSSTSLFTTAISPIKNFTAISPSYKKVDSVPAFISQTTRTNYDNVLKYEQYSVSNNSLEQKHQYLSNDNNSKLDTIQQTVDMIDNTNKQKHELLEQLRKQELDAAQINTNDQSRLLSENMVLKDEIYSAQEKIKNLIKEKQYIQQEKFEIERVKGIELTQWQHDFKQLSISKDIEIDRYKDELMKVMNDFKDLNNQKNEEMTQQREELRKLKAHGNIDLKIYQDNQLMINDKNIQVQALTLEYQEYQVATKLEREQLEGKIVQTSERIQQLESIQSNYINISDQFTDYKVKSNIEKKEIQNYITELEQKLNDTGNMHKKFEFLNEQYSDQQVKGRYEKEELELMNLQRQQQLEELATKVIFVSAENDRLHAIISDLQQKLKLSQNDLENNKYSQSGVNNFLLQVQKRLTFLNAENQRLSSLLVERCRDTNAYL